MTAAFRGAGDLALDPALLDALRERLPLVAGRAVKAITAEVPPYAQAFTGPMGATIESAVRMALGVFLTLAAPDGEAGTGDPLHPALTGAYQLGQGEARSGRSADALLAAYRVGARVSWRELAGTAVERGVPGDVLVPFAELVFAYIDELSAASVAGHADEVAQTGRARERRREHLAAGLVEGLDDAVLLARAQRADWSPPEALTAVLLPSARARDALALLDPRTLALLGDAAAGARDPATEPAGGAEGPVGGPAAASAVLLVPSDGPRRALLSALRGRRAVVGPARPWQRAAASYRRALRTQALVDAGQEPVDTEEHLASLVLSADPEALADLRRRSLEPLDGLPEQTRERLAETLSSWLLHQGRREEVAAALHVHPQTVRYRMTQVRELFGDRLHDPEQVRALVLALGQAGPAPRP